MKQHENASLSLPATEPRMADGRKARRAVLYASGMGRRCAEDYPSCEDFGTNSRGVGANFGAILDGRGAWPASGCWQLTGVTLLLAILSLMQMCAFGQTLTNNEAISRETSVFNFGPPSANVEAISREFSVFNFGPPTAPVEAISRELSVMNLGLASAN